MNLPTPTKGEVWLSVAIVCLAALALSVVACDPLQAQTTAPGPRLLWDQLRAEWRLPAHIEDMSDEQYARHAALCEAQRQWQRETAKAGVITSPTEDWQKQQRRYVEQALRNRGLVESRETSVWQWSPSAPHHAAACRVTSPDGSSGSGVYVDFNGLRGVLTAAHVLTGPSARVRFSDGSTQSGSATVDKDRHDVGIVFATHASIQPLAIAAQPPQQGERVEFLGYGGPVASRGQLRHFFGRVLGSDGTHLEIDAPVMNGDSGAGIVNAKGEVIGIQSVGIGGASAVTTDGWQVYSRSGSAPFTPIRSFLGRVHARFHANFVDNQQVAGCYGGSCQPAYGGQAGGAINPGATVPPASVPAPQPAPAPIAPIQPQANCPCDLSEIEAKFDHLQALIAKLDAPSPPPAASAPCGPAGPPGPKGEPCDLQAVIEGVYAKIEANADKFRGPPGPPGPPGDSATPTSPAKHWVVIGDPEAEYAKRLEREVAETKPVYDQIELIPPPEDRNVGLLPKLVLFSGATPVLTYAGTRDVYLQLSRIRRGEVQ